MRVIVLSWLELLPQTMQAHLPDQVSRERRLDRKAQALLRALELAQGRELAVQVASQR